MRNLILFNLAIDLKPEFFSVTADEKFTPEYWNILRIKF